MSFLAVLKVGSKWAIRPLMPARGAGASPPVLSAEHMIVRDSNRPDETNKRHPDRHQQYLVAHDELLGRSEEVPRFQLGGTRIPPCEW